ncbi:MAG: hypothetical protein C5B50_18940 [Verrucomicrobia bacterium]|nr:MAG: hypothetical protein C5B50_18940 [Verrucomicrobiota bacterium]
MEGDIAIAKAVSIRELGHDEVWLQDQICKNPSILGFGDLEVLDKERRQLHGGRLDILLKDPDNDAMYEVEVMLGETDETHIIRTIEYWNRERRRFPQRQHSAVLVAEHINRRFFEVIHLFSHSIPLIAIQASIIETAGAKSLLFTKILDAYDEPDDSANGSVYQECNEGYWRQESPGTLDTSKALLEAISPTFPTAELHYVNSYIAVLIDGQRYLKLETAGGNKSRLVFWFSKKVPPEVNELLAKTNLPYSTSKIDAKHNEQRLYIIADSKLIAGHSEIMAQLTQMTKLSWDK